MEEKGVPDQSTKEPRRLTRVEQARLETLKSFGCEDFASVMQTAKKLSLKKKLNLSKKKDGVENKDCLKVPRRKSTRGRSSLQSRKTRTRQRLTKTELAKIESLKSFENYNLADITDSSKRIVSKFLNKPAKKRAVNTTEVSKIAGELSHNSATGTSNNKNSDKLANKQDQSEIASPEKMEFTLSKKFQNLLEANEKVLKTAKDLDS